MDGKKISFGFSKINKKPNLLPTKANKPAEENKIELIKCLEGKEIKLVEEKQEIAPLVIPLKENQKTSSALASLIKRRAVLLGEEEEQAQDMETTEPLNGVQSIANGEQQQSIEQRAAKEILDGLKANGSEGITSNLVLPVVHPDDLPLEGAKESSMDDYDNVPIEQFGKAMLRGMGWVEPPKATKGGPPIDDGPILRPKGMGLGADKALKPKPLLVAPESNEILEIKRHAFVRILGGKHKDLYGQIEGFDDHAGRVIVRMAIGGIKEAFNEFLCQPVSKKEYAQYGKCINSTKYEEYKKKENEHGQIIIKKEDLQEKSLKFEKSKIKKEIHSSDEDCKIVQPKTFKDESKRSYKDEDKADSRKKNSNDQKSIKAESTRDYDRQYKNDDHKTTDRSDERSERYESKRSEASRHRDESQSANGNDRRNKSDQRDKQRDAAENERSSRARPNESSRYRDDSRNANEDRRNEQKSLRRRETDEQKYRQKVDSDDSELERNSKSRHNETSHHRDSSKTASGERWKDSQHRRDNDKRDQRHRDNSEDDKYTKQRSHKTKDVSDDSDDKRSRPQRSHKHADDYDDSEDESIAKHKKFHKSKKSKKKSKKTKKSSSKHHHDSSDSESSSESASSSASESEDERQRRHKKKTKKSKKQRERSRSRNRR